MKWCLSGQGYKHLAPGFQDSYCSNFRLLLCKILILLTQSFFVSGSLFIYIYFLLFEENRQDRISRSEEKILQRFNPIWTGLFGNLKDWGGMGGILSPLHNLAISSQKMMKHGNGMLWERSLHIDKNIL